MPALTQGVLEAFPVMQLGPVDECERNKVEISGGPGGCTNSIYEETAKHRPEGVAYTENGNHTADAVETFARR